LVDAIGIAQGIVDNTGDYAPASVAGLRAALSTAQAVNANLDATQTQVDEAKAALDAALSGLVPADAPAAPDAS
jgi:alkylation response protein AidB-like acyl-CoA dehydrogenase